MYMKSDVGTSSILLTLNHRQISPDISPRWDSSVRSTSCCASAIAVTALREIRADYDRDTIVVYQAYSDAIADAALRAGRFVAPFSFNRMTWIKPSFLWLMARSNWGAKSGQERTLAVRITRAGWEKALSLGVVTDHDLSNALVHVQWDTERSLRGQGLGHYAIQVGISRHLIREYVEEWTTRIDDFSDRVQKIRALANSGQSAKAQSLLPREHVYPVSREVGRRLRIDSVRP